MIGLNNSDVLYVTIKKVYFDLILSGAKTEEYREPTDYWFRRLMISKNGIPDRFKPFKYIRLCVGYHRDREEAILKIKNIYLAKFVRKIPEGFQKGDTSFVIELGELVTKKTKIQS